MSGEDRNDEGFVNEFNLINLRQESDIEDEEFEPDRIVRGPGPVKDRPKKIPQPV